MLSSSPLPFFFQCQKTKSWHGIVLCNSCVMKLLVMCAIDVEMVCKSLLCYKGLHTLDAFFLVVVFFVKIICLKIFFKWLIGHEYFHRECEYHAVNKQPFYFSDRGRFFPNFRTASKCISQSWWLCGTDFTSVSHNNNINDNSWQAHYLSLSIMRQTNDVNFRDNDLRQHTAKYQQWVGQCKWWVTLTYVVYFWMWQH